jgi:general secretion pathway protein E
MSNLAPYAFARDFVVLAQHSDDPENTVEVLVCGATAPAAIAEVSRRFGRIQLQAWTRADLEAAIAGAYASSGGDASRWPTNSTPTST